MGGEGKQDELLHKEMIVKPSRNVQKKLTQQLLPALKCCTDAFYEYKWKKTLE